jgi:hypothetical protein
MPVSKAADGLSSPIGIVSPVHQTYNASWLFLKLQIFGLGASTFYYSMTYSIDGQANVTLPFTTETHEHSFELTMTGQTTLHQLSEGIHNITAYQRLEAVFGSSPPEILWDSDSVNFTIDDQKAPSISNLSIENKTYPQDNLQLNFTLDESTSWIGYSLDRQDNVTVYGNLTLANLPSGSHGIQVFANDTVGNIAASDIAYFSIAQPSNAIFNQTNLPFAALAIVISAVTLSLLVFFKRHESKTA